MTLDVPETMDQSELLEQFKTRYQNLVTEKPETPKTNS